MAPNFQPATAESGTFTEPAPLENTYTSDISLQRSLQCESVIFILYRCQRCLLLGYIPSELRSNESHFIQLGAEAVSDQIREWSADAERNPPYVKSHNVWGKRYDYDRLYTTEGWKQLGKWGARNRIVSAGYDTSLGIHRRVVQYGL